MSADSGGDLPAVSDVQLEMGNNTNNNVCPEESPLTQFGAGSSPPSGAAHDAKPPAISTKAMAARRATKAGYGKSKSAVRRTVFVSKERQMSNGKGSAN